jgi:hypothetical protein
MAYWPNEAHLIFGAVAATSFFVPGWKYYLRKRREDRERPSTIGPALGAGSAADPPRE